MPLILATTGAFVVWVVLWSLGAKGFDGFMVTLLIVVVAATARILASYFPGAGRQSP